MRSSLLPAFAVTAAIALGATPAGASIYGTMSNFDIYNETETEAHGAEIELEDIHISDLSRTFPSNFDFEVKTEYNDGVTFGTRIIYTGYNFDLSGFLAPTVGVSTNGHTCVGTAGCEHFGFSVVKTQPTAARFFWLDANGNRIGSQPIGVPTPTWSFNPAGGGGGGGGGGDFIRAEIEVPEVEIINQKPDSIWMKVYKTKVDRAVDLDELMSDNDLVPDGVGETESEWELLEGGKMKQKDDNLNGGDKAIIRRYEYYEYTGEVDAENEPLSIFLDQDLPAPPEGELGQFIAANMVAANLAAPVRTLGDFNDDGVVDASDYTVWRDQYGSEEYEADGDDDGDVDMDDYNVWNAAFGNVLDNGNGGNGGNGGPGGGGNGGVPEPTSGTLLLLGFLLAPRRTYRSGKNA